MTRKACGGTLLRNRMRHNRRGAVERAARLSRGNRPGFSTAAPPDVGRALYEHFARQIAALGIPTQTGSFGADMAVTLTNDGPVTIWVEV